MTTSTASPYPITQLENIKNEQVMEMVDKKLHFNNKFNSRQKEVGDKRTELGKEYNKYRKLNKRCKKYNNVNYLSTALMTVGVGLSTTGLITSTTGLGAVVGLPAGIVGVSAAGVSATLQVISTFVHNKQIKYVILKEKSYLISKEFNRMYHKANDDQNIDEFEYNALIAKYDEYIQFKNNTENENKINDSKN